MYTSVLADVTSVLADTTSGCSVQVYATDGLLMATPPPLRVVARAPSPSQIHGTSSRFSWGIREIHFLPLLRKGRKSILEK